VSKLPSFFNLFFQWCHLLNVTEHYLGARTREQQRWLLRGRMLICSQWYFN